MNRTRKRQIAVLMTTLFALACLAMFLVVRSRTYQVAYHKREMRRAYDAHYAKPPVHAEGLVGQANGDEYARFEHHRAELVRLGAVFELEYRFRYLKPSTDEGTHFLKFIMSPSGPNCIDFLSPHPNVVEPLRMTVWCYPEDKPNWDQLVSSRDIPNYRAVFMR